MQGNKRRGGIKKMSIIEVKIDGKTAWVSLGKGKCAELWVNGKKSFLLKERKCLLFRLNG